MTSGFVQSSERAQGPVATFLTNDLWNLGFPRFQADSPVNDPRLSDSNGIFGNSGRKARFRAIGQPFTGKVASTRQTAVAPYSDLTKSSIRPFTISGLSVLEL